MRVSIEPDWRFLPSPWAKHRPQFEHGDELFPRLCVGQHFGQQPVRLVNRQFSIDQLRQGESLWGRHSICSVANDVVERSVCYVRRSPRLGISRTDGNFVNVVTIVVAKELATGCGERPIGRGTRSSRP